MKIVNCKLIENWKLEIGNYQKAISLLGDITHIAVTAGPGLIGSLLVGFNAAKTLAYALNKPIIPINHIEGHIYSSFAREISNFKFQISNVASNSKTQNSNKNQYTIYNIQNSDFQFPILALTVSGGHTSLTLMKDHGVYKTIGQTVDDAAGEAYDKVAKLLGLGYPGGPEIAKLAHQFRDKISNFKFQISNNPQSPNSNRTIEQSNNRIVFPRPMINDGTFNFSFSGLKTAVLHKVREIELNDETKMEVAAAFEEAVADVLSAKLVKAVREYQPKTVVMAGGVSANQYLRERLKKAVNDYDNEIEFLLPPINLTGDNAAMIGLAAYYHLQRGDIKKWDQIKVDSNMKLN